MNTLLRIALPVLLAAAIIGCSPSEYWTASVYPDRNNLADSISLGSYPSRTECAAGAIDVLGRLGRIDRGDYECGLNCVRGELPAVLVCEKSETPIPLSSIADKQNALRSIHAGCMATIAQLYNPKFNTVPLQLKVKFGLSDNDQKRSYLAFTDAVKCLSATSTDVVPKLGMGPIVFKVYFDNHAERIGLAYRLAQ